MVLKKILVSVVEPYPELPEEYPPDIEIAVVPLGGE